MSNVINNIVKNDTTYAVQDSRVDSMKQDFIATYGVTPFTTIEEHYLNGENVAIIKDNQRYEVSHYLPTGAVGEKKMYFSKIYYPHQSAYTAPNAILDCILVRYIIATSATEYTTTFTEVGKRMYVKSGDTHLDITYDGGQCLIESKNIPSYTAGSNVSISNGVISATDTTYSEATTEASGLMSAADKVKLNGVASNASAVSVSASGTATDEIGYITVNGVEKKIAGGSGVSSYTDLTNKPQINSVELSGNKSLSDLGINVLNAGANITVSGNTISAVDTKYTAGTGIAITNGVISNTQTPGPTYIAGEGIEITNGVIKEKVPIYSEYTSPISAVNDTAATYDSATTSISIDDANIVTWCVNNLDDGHYLDIMASNTYGSYSSTYSEIINVNVGTEYLFEYSNPDAEFITEFKVGGTDTPNRIYIKYNPNFEPEEGITLADLVWFYLVAQESQVIYHGIDNEYLPSEIDAWKIPVSQSNGLVTKWSEDMQRDEIMLAANLPENDGTYVLKCTITDGVPTYTWEAQS